MNWATAIDESSSRVRTDVDRVKRAEVRHAKAGSDGIKYAPMQ